MKKFKKLRNVSLTLSLLLVGGVSGAFAWFSATSLDLSSMVNVSSQTASPSTLVAATSGSGATVEVWCYQLNNAGETIMIKSASTGFSTSATTGTVRLNCPASSAVRQPLKLEDYQGPLYAVTNSTYTIPVQVLRKR